MCDCKIQEKDDGHLINRIVFLINLENINRFKNSLKLNKLGFNFNNLLDQIHEIILNNTFNRFFNFDKISQYLECCEILIDFLFEQLNIGKWYKVKIDIRFCFGLLTIYKILVELFKTCLCKDGFLNSILYQVDYGLIFCPPFENNLLSKIATILHDYLFKTKPILKKYETILWKNVVYPKLDNSKEIPRVKINDLDSFYQFFFKSRLPVIIENAINDWPAISNTENRWTIDYLLNKCAYRLIPIEIGTKYTDLDWTQKLIFFHQFIDDYLYSNDNENSKKGYCAQYELFDRIEVLKKDFIIPKFCAVNNKDKFNKFNLEENVHINAWFGPQNTISPLHQDIKHNLLAQVFGLKYIRLYSPKIPSENYYLCDSFFLNNTSEVDIENINFDKYPNFPREYQEAILKKGDLLFIPANHWHYLRSLSNSFSISFWWS